MRYSAEHKAQTRERLLDASGVLAKRGGFASTGVDGLMKAIGLSGGAFYGHFPSKDALFAQIVERELGSGKSVLATSADAGTEKLRRCLALYLDMAHVSNVERGCAIPSLGPEIARAEPAVRERAEHWLLRLQQGWAKVLESDELAWAFLAQCVGALLLARMMVTPANQQQVLSASKTFLDAHLQPPVATDTELESSR